ncbi:MAG: amino acid-binding protein [Planctomycetes bacterium]|nr:amino acid-binding protein [Planctomycetota bacterium]
MRTAKQLSVFLENKPGTLAMMCDQLAAREINILAMSVGDTVDYAVVRLVVNKPDEAAHLLGEAGTLVVENEVVLADLPHQIGSLGEMAKRLSDSGVNIEYAYCTAAETQENAVIVFRVKDTEAAISALS